MKKVIAIIILCLGCLGSLTAQQLWKPINCEASWLGTNPILIGVSANGDIFAKTGTDAPLFIRSKDEGVQWESLSDFDVCTFMAFSPQGRIFFFPAEFADVYYSDDDCQSWYNTNNHSVNNNLMTGACAVSNDTLLLWGQDRIDYTFDGGNTWNTANLGFIEDYQSIGDLMVNANGDVYLCVWSYGGPGDGIYHSTTSDLQDWQLVAADNYSIRDMAFDPEGNVVACGWNINGSIGFQHTPGFYLFDSRVLAMGDSGIVYVPQIAGHSAVLSYSLDHGEHFVNIGEDIPLVDIAPGNENAYLFKGNDNYLYFDAGGEFWKSIPNANNIPEFNPWIGVKFFDEASGLYYNITGYNTVEVTYTPELETTGYNLYVGDIVIPETVDHNGVSYTVTAVGDEAFKNCNGELTSVVVSNTVTSVGELAFASCQYLLVVVLPNSVETIGDMAFANSWSLNSVRLPEGIKVLPKDLFINCQYLTSIEIPSTVTRIESRAFFGSGLTSIDLPEEVTYLGDSVFYYCSHLSSVDVPNTVTDLGAGAFACCYELRSIHLPENLTAIPDDLLNNCQLLDSIAIPETVTRIGDRAFLQCFHLTEIRIPDVVTSLGSSAFRACVGLTSFDIPETVGHLGSNLFRQCDQLRTVTLPQTLDTIPTGLFAECSRLDSINIPESVVAIEGWSFSSCFALREVVIPDNVESIGFQAFSDCRNLSRVDLGVTVSNMAEGAFRRNEGNVKLTLVCHGTTPAQCGLTTFPDAALQETAIVPCGCEGLYREAWGDYWQSGNFEEDCGSAGAEWYYEILNDDGSITYQYLHQTNDTTINDKEDIHVIVRINTLYDKGEHIQTSHEYVYDDNDKVYWWNKTLGEFTVLYDFDVEPGDEWEIKVDTNSLTIHVEAVEEYEYEGRLFKMLQVSDAENQFSGTIVRGIGHLTSFFPERLMNTQKGYRVEGIRCFWKEDQLMFKYGEKDCDEVYEEFHDYGTEETVVAEGFWVYPNPVSSSLFLITNNVNPSNSTFTVTNVMGQTLMTGQINGEKQLVDVSKLPMGMYFITIGNFAQKIVVNK
ncbi:MAG: leucine-rich repeat protein [Bacteroidales bacterium]|nr:leucine-rich repeat protein [Bacteroidales bacterium]